MIDFIPYLGVALFQNLFKKKTKWSGLTEHKVIPFPLFHSESLRILSINGFIFFYYVGIFGHGFKSGLIKIMRQRKWTWVASHQTCVMKRPVRLFRPMTVRSGICAWTDELAIFTAQYFQNGKQCATHYVRIYFRTKKEFGEVKFSEVKAALGDAGLASPEFPADVEHWTKIKNLRTRS